MEYLSQCGFKDIKRAYDKFNYYYVSKAYQGDNEGYKNIEPRFF